jgi:DNA polymerase I
MKRPVVLVDGMNQVFRAHFSHASLATADKRPTGAIYGFFSALLDVQRHFGDVDIVVCWEGDQGAKPKPTWRKLLARKMYKANRVANPETKRARAQLPTIQSLLRVMQIPQISVPQLEADDVIGVAAEKLQHDKSAGTIFIFSGDRDFYQCVNDRVKILSSKNGKFSRKDAKDVFSEFQVHPCQWAQFRALSGDTTDNYKALPGIGTVKALKLLQSGLDPSVPDFDSLSKSVRQEHIDFKPLWDKVHLCYILAYIPITYQYHRFPIASQALLKSALKDLVVHRQRSMSEAEMRGAFRELTSMLGDLEMHSFIARRGRFFHGVELTRR